MERKAIVMALELRSKFRNSNLFLMLDDREKTTTSIGVFGWLLFGLSWCLVAVTLPFSLCVLLKVQYSTVQLTVQYSHPPLFTQRPPQGCPHHHHHH